MKKVLYVILAISMVHLSAGFANSAYSQESAEGNDAIALWLYMGQASYDLSGNGKSLIVSTEVVLPIAKPLDFNISLAFLPTQQDLYYTNEGDSLVDINNANQPYLMLDVQPQAHYVTLNDLLDLYLGAGVALGVELADNEYRAPIEESSRFFVVPVFSGGARFSIDDHLKVGAMAKMRYGGSVHIGRGFIGESLELSLGLGWEF